MAVPEVDALVSTVASGFDATSLSFDLSVSKLIDYGLKGYDSKRGASNPHYQNCLNKFKTAYSRVKNPEVFHKMFYDFAKSHKSELGVTLFQDATSSTVTDEFFRSKLVHVSPVNSAVREPTEADKNVNLGPVVYFSDSESVMSVCVPIGELYRAAVAKAKTAAEADKDSEDETLAYEPIEVLYRFYTLLYLSSKEEELKKSLEPNLRELQSVYDDVSPPQKSELSENIGNVMGFVSKMLGMAMPSSGAEIAGAMSKMEKAMTTLVSKVSEKTSGGDSDPATLVATIGEIFQSKETQAMIIETADAASSLFSPVLSSRENTNKSEVTVIEE